MAKTSNAKQSFKGLDKRDISLNMSKAEAVTHLGGDDYMITISGVNHRVTVPKTNTAALLGADAPKDDS